MTLPNKVTDVKELKEWNFDGSSTKQAPGHDSDVFLVSVRSVIVVALHTPRWLMSVRGLRRNRGLVLSSPILSVEAITSWSSVLVTSPTVPLPPTTLGISAKRT
jgi:hypothetical protein